MHYISAQGAEVNTVLSQRGFSLEHPGEPGPFCMVCIFCLSLRGFSPDFLPQSGDMRARLNVSKPWVWVWVHDGLVTCPGCDSWERLQLSLWSKGGWAVKETERCIISTACVLQRSEENTKKQDVSPVSKCAPSLIYLSSCIEKHPRKHRSTSPSLNGKIFRRFHKH